MQLSKIEKSWMKALGPELESKHIKDLEKFLTSEKKKKKVIYPKASEVFSAFDKTPFDKVRVVIIGQDPYHGPDQAHGMCFSVKKGIKPPPSLKNIYKELESDIGFSIPDHGFLEPWAKQGVLLINSVLTVEEARAGSHQKKGWEEFTDSVIKVLNEKKENLVFILWGAPAQKKAKVVDEAKHFILKSPHPSPLAAYRGFFGSKPFSQTNKLLKSIGSPPIDWSL
ncbi:MAG: uracil-DNA glycosylase [Bacteriovoracaceae bacterium]|jgi:uracil-DNA glycosylase